MKLLKIYIKNLYIQVQFLFGEGGLNGVRDIPSFFEEKRLY